MLESLFLVFSKSALGSPNKDPHNLSTVAMYSDGLKMIKVASYRMLGWTFRLLLLKLNEEYQRQTSIRSVPYHEQL